MIKYITAIALYLLPSMAFSGECEKETARKSIICLEKKISALSQNNEKINSKLESVLNSGEVTVVVPKGLPKPKITATHTSNLFQVDVVSCKHVGSSVSCSMLVTNKGDDTNFFIRNKTRAFNEFGESFKIGNAKIANTSGDLGTNSTVNHWLIKSVPVKVEIEFIEVGGKSTQFAAIDIHGYRGRERTYSENLVLAKLRNVAFAP